MGYYTDYNLEIDSSADENFSLDSFAEEFEKITDYNVEDLCGVKWYDSDKDMIKLSLLFPKVRFDLEGEGEESGDIWKAYYINGSYQRVNAEITFPAFDKDKVKKYI